MNICRQQKLQLIIQCIDNSKFRQNVRQVKHPFLLGKISVRQNVCQAKCMLGKTTLKRNYSQENLLGKEYSINYSGQQNILTGWVQRCEQTFLNHFFLADHENQGLKKSYSNIFEIFTVFPRIQPFSRYQRNKIEGTKIWAI